MKTATLQFQQKEYFNALGQSQLFIVKPIQKNISKQNSLILVLNQETSFRSINHLISSPISFLGDCFRYKNTAQLHVSLKLVLNESQVNVSFGNSYLTFNTQQPINNPVSFKSITVKTLTESYQYYVGSQPYKKGFSFNFKPQSRILKEYTISQEYTTEGAPWLYNNPISINLSDNKKAKVEILLSDGTKFHSAILSKHDMEGSPFVGTKNFFESIY